MSNLIIKSKRTISNKKFDLEYFLDKYQKNVIFNKKLSDNKIDYEIKLTKEKIDSNYLQFLETRKKDQKNKSKINNIQNKTGLMNYLSSKNTNYKINLCKNIRMNFHFNILEKNIINISNPKYKIFCKGENKLLINNISDLPKKIKKSKVIMINFRQDKIVKKNIGTSSYDFKHVEIYIDLILWSLFNITEYGKININLGFTLEPNLRDLVLLMSQYCEISVYSLNYLLSIDSVSVFYSFFHFKNKKKLVNELIKIKQIIKESHGFLKMKNKKKLNIVSEMNKINYSIIKRYNYFSKLYDNINFTKDFALEIINYTLKVIIANNLKASDGIFNLIKNLNTNLITLPNNKQIKTYQKININRCFKIYNFLIKNKIKTVLQLGVNYGNISLYIFSALMQNKGNGVMVVPKQKTIWNNMGINMIKKNKLLSKVNTIFNFTNESLSKMLNNKSFDLIYISDWYNYDQTLLNIYYCIFILNKKGYLILDLKSTKNLILIRKLVTFIKEYFSDYLEEKEIKIKKLILFIKKKSIPNLTLKGGNKINQPVFVPLIEGLGNKIFLFAAAYALSRKRNSELIMGLYSSGHDKFGSNQIHYIFPNLRSNNRKLKHHLSFLKMLALDNTKTFIHNENIKVDISRISNKILMTGYYQGYLHFKEYHQELKKLLSIHPDIIKETNEKYGKIFSKNKILGVHIRHGDMYKMMINTNGYVKFPILKKQFYIDAFSKIKNIKDYKIVYFTDNAHNWIQENLLPLYKNSIVMKNNSADMDLYLMSQSDYLIASNSTLAYWAGILGKDKSVIAPKYLMNIGDSNNLKFDNKEYYPTSWIILDNMKTSIWKGELK